MTTEVSPVSLLIVIIVVKIMMMMMIIIIIIIIDKTKQLLQTILRIKFCRKKLRVNAGYVNNMKKLLTT